MVNESLGKNMLAPLVLRVALGVIFLYHGLGKVSGWYDDIGSHWAARLQQIESNPPEAVLAKLDRLPDEDAVRIQEIKTKLETVYRGERPEVPEALRSPAVQLAVTWGELFCGMALLLGAFTRLAAAAMLLIQIGAIALVTWAKGFSFEGGGYEYNLALMAMCLAVALTGGGAFSVDRWVWSRHERRASATAAKPVPAKV